MYIDINKLECHVTPEGKGFLAYIDLGKDENGKRIRPKVRGRSEDEAVKKLEQKLRDMGYVQPKADAPKLDVIINQFTLVPDFVREYRVNYLMSKVESGDIKSRTVENYIYALKPFEQFFQQAMVGDITTFTLNQFFRAKGIEKNGRGNYVYSQTTLNRIELVARMMLKRAVKKGWVGSDPFDSEDYRSPKSNKETEPVEGLSPEELKGLLAMIENSPAIYAPIMLMLNTGMRTQEVLALKWGHIDFENNLIHIEQAVTSNVLFDENGNIKSHQSVVSDTKTADSKRRIGLTPDAKEILLNWKELAPTISKAKLGADDFLFVNARGTHYSYYSFRDKVNDYLAGQDSGMDKMRLHRFRHTVGTLLAAEGRETIQIMRQLGINQEKTLLRYIDKKGNKKIIDGNTNAISQGLAEIIETHTGNSGAENAIRQTVLQETLKPLDSSTMAVINGLLGVVQELEKENVALKMAQNREKGVIGE